MVSRIWSWLTNPSQPAKPDPVEPPPPADFEIGSIRAILARGEQPPAQFIPFIDRLHFEGEPIPQSLIALNCLSELRLLMFHKVATIRDIASLATLPKLETLDISLSFVENVADIGRLTRLKHLSLDLLQELSFLAGLTALERLAIAGDKVDDVSALSNLHELRSLKLRCSSLRNVEPLAKLAALEELDLRGSAVNDVSALGMEWIGDSNGFFRRKVRLS